MGSIVQLALKYLESHPDVVEQLIAELFQLIVAELKKANANSHAS